MDLASSIAESSQSIIPHSEEPEHKKHDMVEVRTQTRGSRIYTSVGRVKFVRPGGYVKLYVSEILFQSYTKFYTFLGVDDFKRYTVTIGRLDFAVLLIVSVVLL